MRRFAVVLLLLGAPVAAQQEVEWSGARWALFGDARVEEHLGRQALRFRTGAARLEGEPFENGTIEYDVAVAGPRSFTGVSFRRTRDGYEHFYIRPHQTGRFDAMQYTPDWNGLSAWQLYPEYNASVDIPWGRWMHVKLVVSGSRLRAYFDGAAAPALDVERMRRGPGAGAVVLTSNFPGRDEDDSWPNAYANVTVTRDPEPGPWAEPGTPSPTSGLVPAWSVSAPRPGPERPVEALPDDLDAGPWRTAHADGSGRVNVAELAGVPEGERRGIVYARLRLRSERAQVKRMGFGFSDQASVFLNGRLLFTGNNSYRSRSQRYLGVMTVDNDALYLPLEEGENDLVIAVIESFGGWGLTARFDDRAGLEIRTAE